MRTIGYYVAAIAPNIVGQLISAETLCRIYQIADLLPGSITDFFGFECTLGTDLEIADFLVCCRNRQTVREILANQKLQWDVLPSFQQHPVWRRIGTFSQVWTNPASPLYREVHNLWMEFDIDGTPSEVPAPCVFIGPHQLRGRSNVVDVTNISSQCAWLTELALPLLLDSEIHSSFREQLARCLNLLPASAFVFQVGLMLTRVTKTTRLCIRGISRESIVEYLRAVDWQGRCSELEELLESLGQYVSRVDLDLDITDQVHPRIGLECYVDTRRLPAFISYLVSSNLCTRRNQEALGQWQGVTIESPGSDFLPEDLLAGSKLPTYDSRNMFVRSLHHVKIVYRSGTALEAKGYLGVHHKCLAQEQKAIPR
jgi:hypothetical protein